ncbi:hypothetical protein V8G54_024137 [Vigna mungo]|uniref:Aminotransferase-like plant mobile domain-containing protein n=1 Tax=Vigna mungo TaxID=3915 RepID=A0AAQ3RT74_VIGMU
MNSLLQSRHESRIAETPFRWLLEIVDPIELNMKLFKQLVRRWVPHHQSFRVRQQLVPLNVVDVVMSLGLGLGGMEVQFDESIVGKVGELFNLTKMKLKEMVNMFNNIVVNKEVDVDVLWVYERLCLHDNSSCKVFPRLRRFRSLDYDTEEIDLLLKKGEVQFDWYLSSTDQQNPIICAAFNMDAVGRSEVEPEIGYYSCEYAVGARDQIAAVRKELRDRRKTPKVEQYRLFMKLGNEGAGGDVEEEPVVDGHEVAAHDEVAVDAPEQGLPEQGAHEEPTPEEVSHVEATVDAAKEAVAEEDRHAEGVIEEASHHEAAVDAPKEAVLQEGAHEKGAPEETAHHEATVDAPEEAVPDEGAHEEGAFVEAAHHEAVDEVAVDEASADAEAEDEESVHQPPPIINLADVEDDEVISHVQPLVVEPLKTFHGDPRESVDLFRLYYFVTRKGIMDSYVCEINGQLLTTKDCNSLGPRECVDNMVVMFAATMFMHIEKRSTEFIKRVIFSPMFSVKASHLLSDNKKRIANRQVWQLSDYHPYFPTDLLSVQDLVSADLVRKVSSQQFFVIDSLEKGIRGRAGFDRSIISFIVDVQW